MMSEGPLHALLRWIVASAVGIAVVITAAMVPGADLVTMLGAALLLVLAPLAIARRWPQVGTWLAAAMLAACPVTLLMLRVTVDEPLILSDWRCGNPIMALWFMVMPVAATLFALPAGLIWRSRRALARAWRPAVPAMLATTAALLFCGAYRYLEHGSAERAQDVIALASPSLELPPGEPGTAARYEADELVVERTCEATQCELALASTRLPGQEPVHSRRRWDVDTPLLVHRLGRWRILEGKLEHARAPGHRVVFDVERGYLTDLEVHDVADRFGPPMQTLVMLLLGLATVLGSLAFRPRGPLVWRRLGALDAASSDRTEDAIALRMMHVAVLVVAALPLWACAWIGLVF